MPHSSLTPASVASVGSDENRQSGVGVLLGAIPLPNTSVALSHIVRPNLPTGVGVRIEIPEHLLA